MAPRDLFRNKLMTHPLLRDPLKWCVSAAALLAGVLVAEWYVFAFRRGIYAARDEDGFAEFLLGIVAALIFSAAMAGWMRWRGSRS